MKYKALLVDVDGTLVKVKENAMPSKKVRTALEKASKSLSIHLITARPFTDTHNLPNIFKMLPFLSDSIINGGAQIINPRTKEIIVTIAMSQDSLFHVKRTLNNYPEVVAITSQNKQFPLKDLSYTEEVIKVVVIGIDEAFVPILMVDLSKVNSIAVYQTTSYKNGSDFIITHKNATKEQTTKVLLKKYKFKKEEIIGVGDTTHDLPFLQQCGVKVAMGNAQQKVKDIADIIVPSVDKDGLVTIINEYL